MKQNCQNFVWCDFAGNTFLGRVNELGRRYKIDKYSLKCSLIKIIFRNSVQIFRTNNFKFLLYSLTRWVIGNRRKRRKHEKRESEWAELPGMNILGWRKSNIVRHLLQDFVRKFHYEHLFGRNLQCLFTLLKTYIFFSELYRWLNLGQKNTCLWSKGKMHIFSFFSTHMDIFRKILRIFTKL